MSDTDVDRRTVHARFRIELPPSSWAAELSRTYPTATFRLLTGLRTDGGAIELGEVRASRAREISDAIAAHPSVVNHQPIERSDDRSLARYETTDVALYEFVERSALAPEYPIEVRDGRFAFELTGTRSDFDRVRAGLEASPLSFELASIVEAADTRSVLTDRQRQVLDAAVRAGYYEVPRGCTLVEVAETVDVDKSTASEILRRANARLVEWYRSTDRGGR